MGAHNAFSTRFWAAREMVQAIKVEKQYSSDYQYHINNKFQKQMVSCFTRMSKILRMFDLFPNSKLLRYNGDPQYDSTTGGFISVAVLVVFIILFASMGLRTVQRDIIFSTTETESQINPPQLNVTMGPGGDMMFAVMIQGFNLSGGGGFPKLFDVTLDQVHFVNGMPANSTRLTLQQCTQAHFDFNPDLSTISQRIPIHEGLCPPIGSVLNLKGKLSSSDARFMNLTVARCNSTIDPTCANDTMLATIESLMGRFVFLIPFINTNINPGSQQYRKYYWEDQNAFYFSSTLGTLGFAQISEDLIQTDQSIMPYEDIKEEKMTRIPDEISKSHFSTSSNSRFIQLLSTKQPVTTTYERSFNKIDAYFSYVGGLVGTIIGLIFIMEFYTEKAYEVSLSRKILLDNDKNEISSRSFNLLYYFSMALQKILNLFNYQPDWPSTKTYTECCQEISMQIDITYIVRKLMFMDAVISKLLEKHEIEALNLKGKPTIKEANEMRKKNFYLQIWRDYEQKDDDNERGGDKGGGDGPSGNGEVDGNFSKQNIMLQELGQTGNKFYEKQKQSQIQDVSAIQFDIQKEDIQRIKQSVKRVARQNRQGKPISRRIMEDIDTKAVKQFLQKQEEEDNKNIVKVSPIPQQFQKSQKKSKKKMKEDEQFDYSFDR